MYVAHRYQCTLSLPEVVRIEYPYGLRPCVCVSPAVYLWCGPGPGLRPPVREMRRSPLSHNLRERDGKRRGPRPWQSDKNSQRPAASDLSPGCRAVELSRLRRGAVEALSRRCRGAVEALPVEVSSLSSLSSSCRACRGLSRLTPCAWASSSCRGLSSCPCCCRAVESCRAMSSC